ncbi:MAG TPA: glycosyltransferase family 2 protein [Planctomycetota bacterium]|nr:glycosyltransferase family 2 protein [Planctomycetota bacterium]
MARRAELTACIITFNEERNLPDALASVAFADEIVMVDSRSTDRTREIAAAFRGRAPGGEEVAPRVIERDWPGHVEQKNFAIDQATHDWVLCVDADERVSPELRREVEEALSRDPPGADGYTMPRKTHYLGRWILHGGWYPDRKLRLFRRSRGRWGGTNPHDHVHVDGIVKRLRGDLYHYSYRGMADHLRTIDSFTAISAREKARKGVRWPILRMGIHPPFKFFKMYILKQGFREGVVGLIVAMLGSFYVFLKYAKLWELREREWKDTPPGGEPGT